MGVFITYPCLLENWVVEKGRSPPLLIPPGLSGDVVGGHGKRRQHRAVGGAALGARKFLHIAWGWLNKLITG